jgi:hypothetical protein
MRVISASMYCWSKGLGERNAMVPTLHVVETVQLDQVNGR